MKNIKTGIKENFVKFKELIKDLFKQYPVTMALVYIITLIFTLFTNTIILHKEWMERTIEFLSIWVLGTFFTESIFKQKKSLSIITYVITGAISLIFAMIKTPTDYITRLQICYILTLIITSLFFIIKDLGKDISEYILKVGISFLKISFIYGILATGIAIILYVFSSLILEINTKYILNIE